MTIYCINKNGHFSKRRLILLALLLLEQCIHHTKINLIQNKQILSNLQKAYQPFLVTSFDSICVVALKGKASVLLLPFEDTDVCPRHIAVLDVTYCAEVGFVLKPLHVPIVDKSGFLLCQSLNIQV